MTSRGVAAMATTQQGKIGDVGQALREAALSFQNHVGVELIGAAQRVPYFVRQVERVERGAKS